MVFSSPTFLFCFLPLVLWASFLLGDRIALQNGLLLVASLFFYASGEGADVALLLGSIALNYTVGRSLSAERPRLSRWLLGLGIAANLALLGTFKYASYVADLINTSAGEPLIRLAPIALPVGISFFTFHSMSYLIDVNRGVAKAQESPFRLALYIVLFPQLIAGPIVRYGHVAAQLVNRQRTRQDFALGVRRFITGLGKKVLIADNLSPVAGRAFDTDTPDPTLAWLGAICFMAQIYFDFSGYSDMAIGLARMFGFEFRENFEHPYESRSVVEFWRRWHISLSSWFRDYLYIPLGGNRCSPLRKALNLWIVFVLCGLWHGAATNFLAWGIYHGGFLVLERTRFGRWLEALPRSLAQAYTLLVVLVGWVLFRAAELPQAVAVLGSMTQLPAQAWAGENGIAARLHAELDPLVALSLVGALVFATRAPLRWLERPMESWNGTRGRALAADAGLLACFVVCLVCVAATTFRPFLYFRF